MFVDMIQEIHFLCLKLFSCVLQDGFKAIHCHALGMISQFVHIVLMMTLILFCIMLMVLIDNDYFHPLCLQNEDSCDGIAESDVVQSCTAFF